jgi:serine protease Do
MKAQKRNLTFLSLIVILTLAACGTAPSTVIDNPLIQSMNGPQDTASSTSVSGSADTSNLVSDSNLDSSASISALPEGLTPSEQVLVKLYETANPSVVSIRVVMNSQTINIQGYGFPGMPDQPNTIPSQGEGSGFVYDKNGYIVTNYHVVEAAQRIIVTFYDGSEAEATVAGTDPAADLAVVKVSVDASMLIPVVLGDSESLKVGQTVVALGTPFSLQNSMSTGIVSGMGRMLSTTGGYSIPDLIQTDAAINPGNSGGPLLTLSGEVIGVNTAIESDVRQSSGVGYALPSALVKMVVPELIAKGKVEHAWLGISGLTMNADLAKAMNLDTNTRGVLVAEVKDNAPAAKAGLKGSTSTVTVDGIQKQIGGDIITSIDGHPVKVFDDMLGYVFIYTRPGDTLTLTVLRDGQAQEIKVTVEARPAN